MMKKRDTAESMNKALSEGKHLLLTPGIYSLTEPIVVENENTIVMGMGLATLESKYGDTLFEVGYDASEETTEKEVPVQGRLSVSLKTEKLCVNLLKKL